MVLSQEVSVSLSIIALVSLIGAGVGVGSGIGASCCSGRLCCRSAVAVVCCMDGKLFLLSGCAVWLLPCSCNLHTQCGRSSIVRMQAGCQATLLRLFGQKPHLCTLHSHPQPPTGMMSMAAAEQQKKEEESAPAAAHSPLEPVVISRGFAASIFKH